ncbi:MAG TPA: hypothetical protein VG916_10270 [Gemmatimonadaceae bacterium]|nr:hypothetical protein [Gemmatimonadaceae bacterium]
MFLFKAARATYLQVIGRKRHAFPYGPQEVRGDELVLLAENRAGGGTLHKQVQYVAKLRRVRPAPPAELDRLFPGENAGQRWRFVVDLYFRRKLTPGFNLHDVEGFDYRHYRTVQGFSLIRENDQLAVIKHLIDFYPSLILELADRSDDERDAS